MALIHITREELQGLRENYPPGCRVELIEMPCEPRIDMIPGLRGTVAFVDDAGGIHVHWENGSSLAAIYGVDKIKRID